MNLVLIGYRGTGKSRVARLLSERLRWPVFDADDQIERFAGRSIARIFNEQGEEAFRDFETQVVEDLAQRPKSVLALGGGAILRERNRAAIAQQGRVVWLTASPETILRRIEADSDSVTRRPNLTATGGITEIIATLEARNPIYRQCADLVVDTEDKTPAEVADAILAQWNLHEEG